MLVVGGAREVMYCDEDKIELVMSRRKGFIRLALKHGRDLVPTFSFGENFVYDQLVSTVRVDSLPHRKWREIQQQPGTAGPGNMLGCCLISFHFL